MFTYTMAVPAHCKKLRRLPVLFRKNIFLILIFLLAQNILHASGKTTDSSRDGLFIIQFSWNSESFSKKHSVAVEYKKDGFLTKAKHSGNLYFPAAKNNFITVELPEGDYEMLSFKIQGESVPYGKVLMVPFNKKFTVTAGQITNGGLMFIGKEEKDSNTIFSLKLDNTPDVHRYINNYKPAYSPALQAMTAPWKFLDNALIDGIVEKYAEVLVRQESRRARPKVTYLYATLGIILKMEKDAEGKVLSHELLPSPTYQQIMGMKLIGDKVLCDLPNGDFLYGPDLDIQYMPMPQGLENNPEIHQLSDKRFLMVDDYVNIFSSEDDSFDWTPQNEHRIQRDGVVYMFHPTLYKGPRHLYLYATGSGANKFLLRASYEDLSFTEVPLSRDVKRVTMVTETENKLILGPLLKPGAKPNKPAYLYVQENGSPNWEVVALPRGDCNRFSPYKDNDSMYYCECGSDRIPYQSKDSGQSWEPLKDVASKDKK